MTVIVLVIVGAVIVGLVGNLLFHERIIEVTNRKGIDTFFIYPQTNNVFGPSGTLLALFIAFVLFGAASSYSDAKSAAQTEAATMQYLYKTADYVPDPERFRLQRATVCYARAIIGPDWDDMSDAKIAQSPVPAIWTGTGPMGIRNALRKAGADSLLFETLLSTDQDRADRRRSRLTEAEPSIPGAVNTFMLFAIALTIVFLALISPRRSVAHSSATLLAALTLVGALYLIHNLDRPFSGRLAIQPTQMRITEEMIEGEFVDRYGEKRLGCDKRGNPAKTS
jgi:hypothetical protein